MSIKGIASSFPPCVFGELNLGHQAWQQESLPAEPPCHTYLLLFTINCALLGILL